MRTPPTRRQTPRAFRNAILAVAPVPELFASAVHMLRRWKGCAVDFEGESATQASEGTARGAGRHPSAPAAGTLRGVPA